MANDFPFEAIYSIQGVLLAPFVSVGLTLFLLGFYVLLFGMVVYFLFARRDMVNRKLHLGWVIVLFMLSVSSSLFEISLTLREATLAFYAASTKDTDPLGDWESSPIEVPKLAPDIISGMFYVLAKCVVNKILRPNPDSYKTAALQTASL
ncbi:hypothetical protein MPER_05700, partial [Moniliophthora perniciosa FA553]